MRFHHVRIMVLAVGISLVAGCAARRPVLYPDQRAERAGNEGRDVAECEQLASDRGAPGRGNEIARDTVVGTGTGAAVGAVGGAFFGGAGRGAFFGGAGRGAAAGAAAGATASVLNGILRGSGPNDTYKSFVAVCLADRGHRVIGWE